MPGRTGPRTEDGKRRASINRLGHGLRVTGVLPCRKDDCFYRTRCRVSEEQPDRWATLEIGDPCPREADMVADWRKSDIGPEMFNTPEGIALLEELISSTLLLDRARMALFIITAGDIVRGEYIARGWLEGPEEIRKIGYYMLRHQSHKLMVSCKCGPYFRGFIALARYKQSLVDGYAEIMKRKQHQAT